MMAEQMRKVSPDTTEIAQRTTFLSNMRRRLEAGNFSRCDFADTTQLIHTYNFVQYFIHPQYGSSLGQYKKRGKSATACSVSEYALSKIWTNSQTEIGVECFLE